MPVVDIINKVLLPAFPISGKGGVSMVNFNGTRFLCNPTM